MSEKRPNVIVFFTDQQRWDTTGIHGNPLDLTPNFDEMANSGTHLSKTFTCQPVCGPARAALQTGIYPTESGCFKNAIPLPKNTKTLAHYFKENGYYTGYIGKWHLATRGEPVIEEERGGYESWLASNALEGTSDAYHTVMYNENDQQVKLPGYRVDAQTDAAIRFIDENKEEPFFLFLSFIEPHHQNYLDNYPPPDVYKNKYTSKWMPPDLQALIGNAPQNIDGYCGMVKRLDDALGRLLDALKSLDLQKDTIILFTSDHGCHFRTRNEEYKRSCHDSSIRIPAAFTGPGFDKGRIIKELVSLIDLPPTLLDAAGIPVPDEMQGRSILPLLREEDIDWPEEVFVQVSESQVGRAIRTERWKYSVVAKDKNGGTDPDAETYTEEYLYDLAADPYELTNLIGYDNFDSIANDLRKRLIKRMVEAGEKEPDIITAQPKSVRQRRPQLSKL